MIHSGLQLIFLLITKAPPFVLSVVLPQNALEITSPLIPSSTSFTVSQVQNHFPHSFHCCPLYLSPVESTLTINRISLSPPFQLPGSEVSFRGIPGGNRDAFQHHHQHELDNDRKHVRRVFASVINGPRFHAQRIQLFLQGGDQ